MARIYVVLGDHDRAIDLYEQLLSLPSELSVAYLRGHPLYAPLRDHPRFKALMRRLGLAHVNRCPFQTSKRPLTAAAE